MAPAQATLFEEIDIDARVWKFEMHGGGRGGSFGDGDFRWNDYADEFFMTVTSEGGRQYVNFYDTPDDLALDLIEGAGGYATLQLPWAIFARGVESALSLEAGRQQALSSKGDFGSFERAGDDHIIYTARCGRRFRIHRDVLEALAS